MTSLRDINSSFRRYVLRVAGDVSTGPPAAFQAPKPPAMWATGRRPIRCRLRRQRRALARRAEEHEALVGREDPLVIFALRIDPELEHPARAMEGAGHTALAVELANVAQVDEHDIVAAMQCERRLDRERLDCTLGRFDQPGDMRGDV